MIAKLLRILGPDYARPVRNALILMALAAVAEGLAYAFLVPPVAAVFRGDPGQAWPWLIAFAGAVMAFGVLRFTADLWGFRSGSSLLEGMYHRLGHHLAELPVGWHRPHRVGEVSAVASSGVLQVMGVIAHLLAVGLRRAHTTHDRGGAAGLPVATRCGGDECDPRRPHGAALVRSGVPSQRR